MSLEKTNLSFEIISKILLEIVSSLLYTEKHHMLDVSTIIANGQHIFLFKTNMIVDLICNHHSYAITHNARECIK